MGFPRELRLFGISRQAYSQNYLAEQNVHLAGALQLHACYATPVTVRGEGLTPFLLHSRRKVEEMRTTVLVLAPTTLALLLTRGAALLNAVKPAEATFPGQNDNTMKFTKRGVSEGTCLLSSGYAPSHLSAIGFRLL